MINVLEYLEESAERFPDKIAVKDEKEEISFSKLKEAGRRIGTYLAGLTEIERPVVIFMDKSVKTMMCFMGALNAGCFYTLIDPSFPDERLRKSFSVLEAEVLIGTKESLERLKSVDFDIKNVLEVEDLIEKADKVDEGKLNSIRKRVTDTSPLYCNFTSGSTGVPKGVLVSHRSTIDFIDNFTEIFGITDKDVIGNQAPFDFDVSVKDIYSALKVAATMVLIPKAYFMFPNNVMDMIEENGVTNLTWAVSALVMLNRLHGLKYKAPQTIKRVMFSGEAMPVKQLISWKEYFPDAMFVNLYGPTEITCNCTYYVIPDEIDIEYKIPLGNVFPNEKVFLLDGEDRLVTSENCHVPAEICVAGTALALGYYNSPETTKKAFTNNPLNKYWNEPIYRTGDLAEWGEDGMLYFAGRKDFQIKHMGHRIELEEIEAVLNNVASVDTGVCFFDDEKKKIVAYYVGGDSKKQIMTDMKVKVPDYMVPNLFFQLEEMPLNKNGKIDRKRIRELYDNR